jgi:hypothetical protein
MADSGDRMFMEINGKAPIVVAHETRVRAQIDAVWQLQTQIAAWPTWNPDIPRAQLDCPLTVNARFSWETCGRSIFSTVREIVDGERLAWSSVAAGLTGVHVWIFTPRGADVLVHTEASWEGPSLASDVDELQETMDVALGRWLQRVKLAAEADRRWREERGLVASALWRRWRAPWDRR